MNSAQRNKSTSFVPDDHEVQQIARVPPTKGKSSATTAWFHPVRPVASLGQRIATGSHAKTMTASAIVSCALAA